MGHSVWSATCSQRWLNVRADGEGGGACWPLTFDLCHAARSASCIVLNCSIGRVGRVRGFRVWGSEMLNLEVGVRGEQSPIKGVGWPNSGGG